MPRGLKHRALTGCRRRKPKRQTTPNERGGDVGGGCGDGSNDGCSEFNGDGSDHGGGRGDGDSQR